MGNATDTNRANPEQEQEQEQEMGCLRMNHGLRLFTFNEAFAWVAAPYYCTALALCEQF